VAVTITSIASSMISLAWSVVAYHKALRMSRTDLKNIGHIGLAFRFTWRLFEVSPRIIIFAMFMFAYGVSIEYVSYVNLSVLFLSVLFYNMN